MLSNCKGPKVQDLTERFPGQLAHLYGPTKDETGYRPAFPGLEWALDNGAFGAMRAKLPCHPHTQLLRLVGKVEALQLEHGERPLWMAIPDVVYQKDPTLCQWNELAPWFKAITGWPLALVVQDGMVPEDVWRLTIQPDVIFVGGSTTHRGALGWKWESLPVWTACFPRVHVGRVNRPDKLEVCYELGVESVDGTGWVRGRRSQWNGLVAYLERHQEPFGPYGLELKVAA